MSFYTPDGFGGAGVGPLRRRVGQSCIDAGMDQSRFADGFVTAPFAAEPKAWPYFASTPDV